MYKIILNGTIIKEFKNIDPATEFYGEHFKEAGSLKMYKDNKLIAKKDA